MISTATTPLQLCLVFTVSRPGNLRETPPRRAYTRADIRHVARHYGEATGPELAQELGRTLGSLKGLIRRHPELKKRGSLSI